MNSPLPRSPLPLLIATLALSVSHPLSGAEKKSAVTIDWGAGPAAPANAAIMAYLGDPVPPPARLDARYTAEGLTAAFRALCRNLGYEIQKLSVDETEFPFLVYGVLEGRCDYREIQAALRATAGYAYSGSSTGTTKDGSTYFALNMMPPAEYPRSHAEAIRRRLMIRLQMLAVIWNDPSR